VLVTECLSLVTGCWFGHRPEVQNIAVRPGTFIIPLPLPITSLPKSGIKISTFCWWLRF